MTTEKIRHEDIVKATPFGILILDSKDKIRFSSSLAASMLYTQHEDLEGISFWELIDQDSQTLYTKQKKLIDENQKSPKAFNLQFLSNNAKQQTLSIKINSFGDGWILYLDDELKIVESSSHQTSELQVLQEQNQKLKKYIDSNLQLENFAYIATHDLKAPLRSMISFIELLKDSAHSKLDDKENKFVKIIHDSSNNMKELIDDLLTYSKVNTNNTVIESTNPKELIAEVLEQMEDVLTRSKASVIIEELPAKIKVDKQKISLVFQNLISNAIKFQHENKTAKINIDGKEEEQSWTINIKDNGIGINREHIDKIFLVFQKLHSKDKFSGSGMGLAICKKVIDQHNGKIWATNNTDHGSTVSFTIPRR